MFCILNFRKEVVVIVSNMACPSLKCFDAKVSSRNSGWGKFTEK